MNSVPILNWKEVALLRDGLAIELAGTHVERVFVRSHAEHPQGFVKSEWVILLGSRARERALIFSVRSRTPYVCLLEAKKVRPSPRATHSAFDLALSKYLRGARLLSIDAPQRERSLVFWFTSQDKRLGLILSLVPAMPEALLVEADPGDPGDWAVIARTRAKGAKKYTLPDGSRAPVDPEVRHPTHDLAAWSASIQSALVGESFELRKSAATRVLRDLLKQAVARESQSLDAARSASHEADWQRYGDLLKAALPEPPAIQNGSRLLADPVSGELVPVPCDRKLTPTAQVERFYQLSKRKARRLDEATSRARDFTEARGRLEELLAAPIANGDWDSLGRLEVASGTAPVTAPSATPGKAKKRPAGRAWLGKVFRSRDGLSILVGRSRDENLELTFRHARGNDLWMHVRGKPGAHIVIPLDSGKSAPLETLLDAAAICVWYSGGEKWGKTEVDYAFKKHVKRIKDSSEASYTHNKTLLVSPDPERLKRLLAQNP